MNVLWNSLSRKYLLLGCILLVFLAAYIAGRERLLSMKIVFRAHEMILEGIADGTAVSGEVVCGSCHRASADHFTRLQEQISLAPRAGDRS